MDTANTVNTSTASTSKKDSECENLDAIKKFIEEQDKNIQEQKSSLNESLTNEAKCDIENAKQHPEDTVAVTSSVMEMILDHSDVEINRQRDIDNVQSLSPIDKGNSCMALSVGSKVEAKNFSEEWYPAQILEVDYEEMEVLVHYENVPKKHDEWISVSSPRLRPVGSATIKPGPSSEDSTLDAPLIKEESKEPKADEKPKLVFVVGERCLARWRDNRRFMATVQSDLGNGKYEIIFDDGCRWTCTTSRMYKLKPTGKELTVDTSFHSPTTSTPSPGQYGTGPSDIAPQGPVNIYPAYHTHLFDPTRDYLGSKSERREKKRKLNIKEIFNIGQKRQKTPKEPKAPVEKKPRILKRRVHVKKEMDVKTEVKTQSSAMNAVASIIGTITKEPIQEEEYIKEEKIEPKVEAKEESAIKTEDSKIEVIEKTDVVKEEPKSVDKIEEIGVDKVEEIEVDKSEEIEVDDAKTDLDPVLEEEVKLEKFEKQDGDKHEEVIVRMKEVINKLEGGLNQEEKVDSPKPEPTETDQEATPAPVIDEPKPDVDAERESPKKMVKPKKGKKLRLLQEKKVKKQVEKVKSELEEMKKQVEEMRKQMLIKTQVLVTPEQGSMMPESFLLPGEWCCKWVNGQPVGTVSEIECEMKADPHGKPPLPRRSVQVEDKRLPEGWTKHMVRRSFGHSAGKWDVVLVSPDNRRFHTKNEMRVYLENNADKSLRSYEHALTDFGVHLKLSRRMGWITHTPDGATDGPASPLPVTALSSTSPLVKRKKLSLKKKGVKVKGKRPRLTIKLKVPPQNLESVNYHPPEEEIPSTQIVNENMATPTAESALDPSMLEDGYVYVGSLKVQIIENLLRCPAEGCFKNFRNNTLLQMHIKHYHRDLRKRLGATPKVLDLAYARTMPVGGETPRRDDSKTIKVKLPKLPKEPKVELKDIKLDLPVDTPLTPSKETEIAIPRSQDSPKLRQALAPKTVKRPRVLLPVRRLEPELVATDSIDEEIDFDSVEPIESQVEIPMVMSQDFEAQISTHTVTRPLTEKKRKGEKRRQPFVLPPKLPMSEEDDWLGINSDVETRSSFPRSGTPDSKGDVKMMPVSSESNEEKDANMYMFTESGERIKIVHMKREEIINCHCGFREEDGLMVQCELCLCWQHALCHNIQRESEVPEKYTCSICLSPRRGRRSRRFLHDQDRLYEGLLPGGRPCGSLRRSHELTGNLLRIQDALHALTVNYYVATKKDHPKLYLWAKDWEQLELKYTQEKLNSDYSDLNIMISAIGKENLPLKRDDGKDIQMDIATSPSEEHDRYTQREGLVGSQSLLSGLLSSPGGASLDLPISTLELERLAKSVQEQECERPVIRAPQPEAAIENSACRERLLKHIQRCQALIDARLDSIEAQVAELESQDPSFEDDETADYFPRTKQTIQMLMRDLDTMEELGVIT